MTHLDPGRDVRGTVLDLPFNATEELDAAWRGARSVARRETDERRVRRGRRQLLAAEATDLTHKLSQMYLPTEIAADRRMTPGDIRVLAILVRAARIGGGSATDISVPEIANRAAVSDRQVQLTADKLGKQPFDLVQRTFRRLRPGMNDTNVYELATECMARKSDAARPESDRGRSPDTDAGSRKGESGRAIDATNARPPGVKSFAG